MNYEGKWTHFYDMHSGGNTKVKPYEHIYVQGEQSEAEELFEKVTEEYPYSVACSCCGENYSVTEHDNLDKATHFERNWGKSLTIEEFISLPYVLLIFKDGSTDKELNN
jgi:hypothetical protein